jgi:general nucleoside transport system permease protein
MIVLRLALLRLLPLWALVLAFALSMGLVRFAGAKPLDALSYLLSGAFADLFGIGTTIVKTTPLLLAGLGVGVSLRAGLFNIGAEGQIYMGGLAAALVGLFVRGLPAFIHLPLALLAAAAGGGLWGLIPGLLKTRRGVNEIISTLLMNYIGAFLVSMIVNVWLKEPGAPYPYTPQLASSAFLPIILPTTDAQAGILIGLALGGLIYFAFGRTTYGFQLKMVGANAVAAAYAGINVNRTMVAAMVVGGALAGLGGASVVLGLQHRLFEGFSPGYGFDAVVIGFLSNGNPIGIIATSFFFGALRSGADTMQRNAGVPFAIVFAIQGLAVLLLAASLPLRQRWTARYSRSLLKVARQPEPESEAAQP